MPKIPDAVIESVKSRTSLLSLLNHYNVAATKKGNSHFATCPFHRVDGGEEKTASLSIDPEQNLYHCFSCDARGNAIQFVQAMEKISFPDAVHKLQTFSGTIPTIDQPTKVPPTPQIPESTRHETLSAFVAACSEELRNSKSGREYLEKRGLPVLELLNSFTIGFCSSNLFKNLVGSEKEKLEAVGLLKNGRLLFENCVIFPLYKNDKITTIYGRRIDDRGTHYMLPCERSGLYLPKQGLNSQKPVILTECIIDSLSLFAAGVTNVLPLLGVNGFLPDHDAYLKEQNFPKIYTSLDGDEAGRRAAGVLQERIGSEPIDLPDNEDLNSMLIDYGAEGLKNWIVSKIRVESSKPAVWSDNSFIFIRFDRRIYRIQGFSETGMDRLKVTLRLYTAEDPANFHMDSVDLYQLRSRERLIADAQTIFNEKPARIARDINEIITILEESRIAHFAKNDREDDTVYAMEEAERQEALDFLRAPNLLDRIADEFTNSGMVGNRTESMLAYLGSLSRLTDKPFGVLIVSRSGAGKSFLQEMVGSFVPTEKLLRMTRLTGQSLFYQGREGLKYKLLTIEEDEGMQDAMYSIRTLLSSQRLSLHSLKTDPKTGDLKAYENTVEGPASVMISTTDLARFDFESVNRFLVIFLDESPEQTSEILKASGSMNGEQKIRMMLQKKQIRQRQQNVQRLLEPLTVVNTLGTGVNYPAHILNTRREQNKLASLIEVIALLHQHQRPIKTAEFFGVQTRYIEVVQSDIDAALSLAGITLQQSLDELSPLGRKLLHDMHTLVHERFTVEKELNAKLEKWMVSFTRRDLQERNGWSVWHLRQHCGELVESGFITPRNGKKGQLYSYSLVVDAIPDLPKIERIQGGK